MTLLHVVILAVVQGFAELLPVSSSAHVIVAEKLMGMNPAAPQMTLLLIMLHTGTMLAVIVYFWRRWREAFFSSLAEFQGFARAVIVAIVLTGVMGEGLIKGIEETAFRHAPHAWVEQLFGRLDLIAPALAAVGILILIAAAFERHPGSANTGTSGVSTVRAAWIGMAQALALPFRGFSRSGATISMGMLCGVDKARAEDFSFALAVIITPAAIAREWWRLVRMQHITHAAGLLSAGMPSLVGAFFAFLAGLLALKWLSRWLETGRWYLFGIYCLIAAGIVGLLYHAGY